MTLFSRRMSVNYGLHYYGVLVVLSVIQIYAFYIYYLNRYKEHFLFLN